MFGEGPGLLLGRAMAKMTGSEKLISVSVG